MSDPGNPTDPTGPSGNDPDPGQPGWASPTPPPTPPTPPPAAPTPSYPPAAPAAPPTPPGFGAPPPPPPGVPGPAPLEPGGWEPAPPAVKKRRLTWLWILIPVLLVFATSVILIAVFAVKSIVEPIETSNDYFAALQDGNFSEAYNLRCAAFKAQVSETEFAAQQDRDGRITDYDIDSFDREDDVATTEGEVTLGGTEYDVTVRLQQEDGDWKVCTVKGERG